MDRIHETGIIGSLRWWYEAIVRGLGGSACDPTGDGKCPDKRGRYCDVCAVFGATGLKRAFRLEGPEWWNEERGRRLKVKVGRHRNHRGWFLGRGFMGEGELNILPLRWPEVWTEEELINSLLLVFALVERWAGVGAKTQQGYGVVAFDGIDVDVQKALDAYGKLKNRGDRRVVSNNNLPSIDGFFFAKVRFQTPKQDLGEWVKNRVARIDSDGELNWYLYSDADLQRKAVLPISPIVRYHLRNLARREKGIDVRARHRLFGEQGKKSLIHISHAYPVGGNGWEFRIWGWMPKHLDGSVSRSEALGSLKGWLGIESSNLRRYHAARNGQFWQALNISTPEVCWFEKEKEESGSDYLGALLQDGCEGGENA